MFHHQRCNLSSLNINLTNKEMKLDEFYYKILNRYFHLDLKVISRLKEVLESGKDLRVDDLVKNSFGILQLYDLLLNGVKDTYLSLRMFYAAIVEHRICKRLFGKLPMKLCCMGGFSVRSALGMCEVIDNVFLRLGCIDTPAEIEIVLIDVCQMFRPLSQYMLDQANLGYAEINVRLRYVQADFCSELSGEVKRIIQSSQIVIMNNFLLDIPSTRAKNICKKILNEMDKRAVLFYQDNGARRKHNVKHFISTKSDFMEMENYRQQFESQDERSSVQQELCNSIFALQYNPDLQPVVCSIWIRQRKVTAKRKKKCVQTSQNFELSERFQGRNSSRQKITIRDSESSCRFDKKISVVSVSEFSRLRGKSPDGTMKLYESDSRKKKKKSKKNKRDSRKSENDLEKNASSSNKKSKKKAKDTKKSKKNSKLSRKIQT